VLIRSVPKGVTVENDCAGILFYYLTGLDNAVLLDAAPAGATVRAEGQLRGFLSLLSPPYAYVDSAEASKQSGLEIIAP
jgi:hypothetical protein